MTPHGKKEKNMLAIRDLEDQFCIQGEIQIKIFDWKTETYVVDEPLTESNRDKFIDREIKYLFPVDGKLVFEFEDNAEV